MNLDESARSGLISTGVGSEVAIKDDSEASFVFGSSTPLASVCSGARVDRRGELVCNMPVHSCATRDTFS